MADDPWAEFNPRPPAAAAKDPWAEFNPQFASGAAKEKPRSLSAGDVAGQAIRNVPSSAAKFAGDIGHAVMHPIETASNLGRLGIGAAQMAGLVAPEEGNDFRPYARAAGRMIKERYGGVENFKRTLATDPVGAAADLSMVLSGGGGVAARLPGIAGKAGEAAAAAGRAVNPARAAAGAGMMTATKAVPLLIGEMGTHTGAESIRTAAQAGFQGGKGAEVFQENLRGLAPLDETVSEARRAVSNLRQQRGRAYQQGMAGIRANQTVLPFTEIDNALIRVVGVNTFKGQSLSPTTAAIRSKMAQAVQHWRRLPPRDYHTPEGLDALKRKLGNLRDGTEYGTPSRKVADDIYHAVRETIIKQAPEYAKVMKAYEQADTIIKELERTLAGKPGAAIDTSLRKLQSILRNNVSTNYGYRRALADYLVNAGAPHLMKRLTGQALSAWFPRGLGKLAATQGAGAAAGLLGGGAYGAGTGMAAVAPFMSPRLMGEAAYYAGKAARPVAHLVRPALAAAVPAAEAGRPDDALSQRDALSP